MCDQWLLVSLVIYLTGVDGWMTQYQESFNFSCPAHQYICSTNSAYDDSYDDRVYDFTCCELTGDVPVQGCKWTGKVLGLFKKYACCKRFATEENYRLFLSLFCDFYYEVICCNTAEYIQV